MTIKLKMCTIDRCESKNESIILGSSGIWSDKQLKQQETAINIVYLNNHKQTYKNEQQFPISCLGDLHP